MPGTDTDMPVNLEVQVALLIQRQEQEAARAKEYREETALVLATLRQEIAKTKLTLEETKTDLSNFKRDFDRITWKWGGAVTVVMGIGALIGWLTSVFGKIPIK